MAILWPLSTNQMWDQKAAHMNIEKSDTWQTGGLYMQPNEFIYKHLIGVVTEHHLPDNDAFSPLADWYCSLNWAPAPIPPEIRRRHPLHL